MQRIVDLSLRTVDLVGKFTLPSSWFAIRSQVEEISMLLALSIAQQKRRERQSLYREISISSIE